jgi:hypothetical protein
MDIDIRKELDRIKREKDELQSELRKIKRRTVWWAGYLLLFLGLVLIVLAIVYTHNLASFIGISLTFWGALLLYIRQTDLIRKEILESVVVKPLKQIHKMLDELEYNGTPRYVSPSTLLGLETVNVYIPKSNNYSKPSDDQIAQEETFINNPPAMKLTPPGLDLSMLLQDDLKTDFSAVDLKYLQDNLEKALVEGFQLAEAFQMEVSDSTVQVTIKGTIFDKIIEELNDLESNRHLGDPLSSAIACILARSTRQNIIIEEIQRDKKEDTLKITYKIEDSTPAVDAK